ncbi:hypothetical protein BC829DRAFT_422024 [Chytridium lagenaria]|nr:hypothetical protein BC829DRAFT_422024 [Chytridium lagenaria]
MFGMTDSGFPCCLFGDVVCWILFNFFIECYHYSDNFFGATHASLIDVTIRLLLLVMGFIGYVMKTHEVLKGTSLKILGFQVDTMALTVTLPAEKRKRISSFLRKIVGKSPLTASDVSMVAGTLTWVCQILPQGRVYLRNVYDMLGKPATAIRQGFPFAAIHDITWFADIILEWPGIEFIREKEWLSNGHFGIVSDSSLTGAGFVPANYYVMFSLCPHCVQLLMLGQQLKLGTRDDSSWRHYDGS